MQLDSNCSGNTAWPASQKNTSESQAQQLIPPNPLITPTTAGVSRIFFSQTSSNNDNQTTIFTSFCPPRYTMRDHLSNWLQSLTTTPRNPQSHRIKNIRLYSGLCLSFSCAWLHSKNNPSTKNKGLVDDSIAALNLLSNSSSLISQIVRNQEAFLFFNKAANSNPDSFPQYIKSDYHNAPSLSVSLMIRSNQLPNYCESKSFKDFRKIVSEITERNERSFGCLWLPSYFLRRFDHCCSYYFTKLDSKQYALEIFDPNRGCLSLKREDLTQGALEVYRFLFGESVNKNNSGHAINIFSFV